MVTPPEKTPRKRGDTYKEILLACKKPPFTTHEKGKKGRKKAIKGLIYDPLPTLTRPFDNLQTTTEIATETSKKHTTNYIN